MKRYLSIILALALLAALPLAARAQENDAELEAQAPRDLKTMDVSGYPCISLFGANHELYYDERNELGERRRVFDPADPDMSDMLEEMLEALKTLDMHKAIDLFMGVMLDWYGEVAMDENGESAPNITGDWGTFDAGNIASMDPYFCYDWRLSPLDNAEKLHDLVVAVKARHGTDRVNLSSVSGSCPIVTAYLSLYGCGDLASLLLKMSMHNGTNLFGGFATRRLYIEPDTLGRNVTFSENLGFELQPWLRILYEAGVLDLVARVMKMITSISFIEDRIYDEFLIPIFFHMPAYWAYVPKEDFETAKKTLLKDKVKYAGLIEKIDRYYNDVVCHADRLLLEASAQIKVGVVAGYGLVQKMPLARNVNAQSDDTVETFRASLGATCSPAAQPFSVFYKQKRVTGYNHISPDRLIDASTCLLPERTWFIKNNTHTEHSFTSWYAWFLQSGDATVFGNTAYPQFMERIAYDVSVPLIVNRTNVFADMLMACVFWLLGAWRWVTMLPLFWVAFLN